MFKRRTFEQGSVIVFEVVGIFIFALVILAVLGYATQQLRVLRSTVDKEMAFQIAEAGINYYQWHLAHYPTDYSDGNGGGCGPCGPYTKDYIDTDTQQVVGQYRISITPPLIGSTIVTIKSEGWTTAQPNIKRSITVRYGIPSLAKYAFLTNSNIHVGSATTFYGLFHSNGGIQYDGVGNAPITSARSTYTCTATDGCSPNTIKPGIWGTAPASTQAFWQFPVPNVDYSAITGDLATIKTGAQTAGLYLAPSNAQGYSIVFQSNGTFRVYKVTSLRAHATGTDPAGVSHPEDLDYNNRVEQSTVCNPYPCQMPTNGLVFVEDKVWVEGVMAGRALVAAAKFPYVPSTAPSIYIPNNLTYLAKDGSNVLGLISQKDILLTYYVPDDLEIDAAFIAQNGAFQRYNFSGTVLDTLTVYGSISSFGQAAIYYGTSGYATRSYSYDSNLLYGPPPSFPLSNEGYQQISWSSN